MAIPYIHVRDAVRFLLRLLDVHDRLQHAETVIASTPGSTAIGSLYDLATRHYFGRPKQAIHVPAPICGMGLHLTDLMGRVIGQRPFERPWMHAYINRCLEVDNDRTCSLLEWSPRTRHHIERRFPLMIERLRSEPLEWRARNDAAMRRETGRPSLHIYKALIAIEEEVVDAMMRALGSREEGEFLPHYQNLEPSEFRWILRLLYRLLLTSIQTSNRLLILNYIEVICADRFRAGFAAEEIRHILRLLSGTILSSLQGRPELRGLGQALYDQITVPFELGMDEVREQYDRFREGEVGSAEGGERLGAGSPTPREILEQTIWKCLVQRK
jgi:hypothetical protein